MSSKAEAAESGGNVAPIGHNSQSQKDAVAKYVEIMLDVKTIRKQANKRASEARELLVEAGLEKDAVRDTFAYFEKRKHEREGYDESHKIAWDVMNGAETKDMFDDFEASEKQDKKAEKDAVKLAEGKK